MCDGALMLILVSFPDELPPPPPFEEEEAAGHVSLNTLLSSAVPPETVAPTTVLAPTGGAPQQTPPTMAPTPTVLPEHGGGDDAQQPSGGSAVLSTVLPNDGGDGDAQQPFGGTAVLSPASTPSVRPPDGGDAQQQPSVPLQPTLTLSPATPPAFVPLLQPVIAAPIFLPPTTVGGGTAVLSPAMLPTHHAPTDVPSLFPPEMLMMPSTTLAPHVAVVVPSLLPTVSVDVPSLFPPIVVDPPPSTMLPPGVVVSTPEETPIVPEAPQPTNNSTAPPPPPPPTTMIPMPTSAPTVASTVSPTTPPAVSSTEKNLSCTTVNGDYGNLTTGIHQTIGFHYSAALDANISPATFTADLLPALEVALNDAIVPTVFGVLDLCTQKRSGDDGRMHRGASSDVTGLSAHPVDDVNPSVPCTGEVCCGIEGTVTIYIMPQQQEIEGEEQQQQQQQASSTIAADELVRQALRRAMDRGTIDLPDGVRELTYVADGPSSVIPSILLIDGEERLSRTIKVLIGGSIDGGVIFAVIFAVCCANYRKRRKADSNGEFIGAVRSTIIPEVLVETEDESDGLEYGASSETVYC